MKPAPGRLGLSAASVLMLVTMRAAVAQEIHVVPGSAGSPDGSLQPWGATLSGDGRLVVYALQATDRRSTVHVYDRETNTTRQLGPFWITPPDGVSPYEVEILKMVLVLTDDVTPFLYFMTRDPLLFQDGGECTPPIEDCNGAGGGTLDVYRLELEPGEWPHRVSVLYDPIDAEFLYGCADFDVTPNGQRLAMRCSMGVDPDNGDGLWDLYVIEDLSPDQPDAAKLADGRAPYGMGNWTHVALAGDGKTVAFESTGSELVAGDTNDASDVFVVDVKTKAIERVSVDSSGTEFTGHSGMWQGGSLAISSDGRFVVFYSNGGDLLGTPLPTNGSMENLYLRDRTKGTTTIITPALSSEVLDPYDCDVSRNGGASLAPSISADGLIVSFVSLSTSLTGPCSIQPPQVYLLNRLTNETIQLSRPSELDAADNGSGYALGPDGWGHYAALSLAGNEVVFTSYASNLDPNATTQVPRLFAAKVPGDRDGDGLYDDWEENGMKLEGGGTLDLPALGANPDHKDLFVEWDFLEAADHKHRFSNIARQLVVSAFYKAPVDNPDGDTGITLHLSSTSEADSIAETDANKVMTWEVFNPIKTENFGSKDQRDDPNTTNILNARRLVYRYALFGHDLSGGVSGRAEIGGNDFMVTLGGWEGQVGNSDQQAATFMHELGHTLGLLHGGGDSTNCKPNYISIMSYSRQFNVKVPTRLIDYSSQQLPTLDEAALVEQDGLRGPGATVTVEPPGARTIFGPPGATWAATRVDANAPINWNLTAPTGGGEVVVRDVNNLNHSGCRGGGTTLAGHDDWAHIAYNFRGSGGFADGVSPAVDLEEITSEIYEAMVALSDDPDNQAPTAEAGEDLEVVQGATVVLDGSASTDPEGAALAFHWLQDEGPEVALDGSDGSSPSFVAPSVEEDTALTFELEVHDGIIGSVVDDLTVTVAPSGSVPYDGGPASAGASDDGGCGCRTARTARAAATRLEWLAFVALAMRLGRRRRPWTRSGRRGTLDVRP